MQMHPRTHPRRLALLVRAPPPRRVSASALARGLRQGVFRERKVRLVGQDAAPHERCVALLVVWGGPWWEGCCQG